MVQCIAKYKLKKMLTRLLRFLVFVIRCHVETLETNIDFWDNIYEDT